MNQSVSPNFNYYIPVFEDLARIDNLDTLEQLCDAIANHLPESSSSMDVLSYGYHKSKSYLKSIKYSQKALMLTNDPEQQCSIRFNISKSLIYSNQPEKALDYLEKNLEINPQDWDSYIEMSLAIYAKNQKSKSSEMLFSLLSRPDLPEKLQETVNFNLADHEFRNGNFPQGMKKLISGRKFRIYGSYTNNFPIPQWHGQEINAGSKVLVVGECGIGDEIINARFAQQLRDLGIVPSYASVNGLCDILQHLPYEKCQNYSKNSNDIKDILEYDYWTPAMDLPVYLKLDWSDLWQGAYLKSTPEHREKWSTIKSDLPAVGVRWSGNPRYEQDLHRSLPLAELWQVLKQTPATYCSLQKDHNSDQISLTEGGMTDLSDKLQTWQDTLGVIANLDLVITSCTSVAHAAAAMDKKTVVMVPILNYYPWSQGTLHSSWYGENVTVIRQTKVRDWSDPLQELSRYLQSWSG